MPNSKLTPVLTILISVLLSVGASYGVFYYFQKRMDRKAEYTTLIEEKTTDTAPAAKGENLHQINDLLITASERAKKSVVTVFTEKVFRVQRMNPFGGMGNPFFDQFFRDFFDRDPRGQRRPDGRDYDEEIRQGMGSGVIVSKDGFILTNNHVVADADSISIRTLDDKTFKAKVIGRDPHTDVAVIKIEEKNLEPIRIGDSDGLRVGEIVLAIGSPMSANLSYTVTQGIVSAKGRSNVGLADYEDFIQTDAAVNPGNSGGALINLDGELIGINTAIASRTGGFQGISFAVPINMARSVMESLMKTGEVVRGWLGVRIQDLTEDMVKAMKLSSPEGALVAEVDKSSPADKGGLKEGDIIVAINGDNVKNGVQLRNRISATAPGTTIDLKVIREGKEQMIKILLEKLPSEKNDAEEAPQKKSEAKINDALGFSVVNLNSVAPEVRRQLQLPDGIQGVLVDDIKKTSPAIRAGLREGDLIQKVEQRPVRNLQEFQSLTGHLKAGDSISVQVYRGGGKIFIAFTI